MHGPSTVATCFFWVTHPRNGQVGRKLSHLRNLRLGVRQGGGLLIHSALFVLTRLYLF